MSSEYDINIKLVQLVKDNPCLYNTSSADYTKKEVIDKAWNTISTELNCTVQDCKEKWRNIRSAFVRSIRPSSKNSATKYKRPYYLYDYLEFLLPYVKWSNAMIESLGPFDQLEDSMDCKAEESSLDHFDNDQISVNEYDMVNPLEDESNVDEIVVTANASSSQSASTSSTKKRKLQDDVLEPSPKKHEKYFVDVDDETAKRYFLLSLLPEIRGLNDDQMRIFKIKVLLLIQNILSKKESINSLLLDQ